jgi:hypothetical protein
MVCAAGVGGFWGGRHGLSIARGETVSVVQRLLPVHDRGDRAPREVAAREAPRSLPPAAPAGAITRRDQVADKRDL